MPPAIATSGLVQCQAASSSTGAFTLGMARTPGDLWRTCKPSRLGLALVLGILGITATSAATLAQGLTLPQQFAITGSQYLDFNDLGLLRGPGDTLPVGPVDAQRMTPITRDLVRSFLDGGRGEAPVGGFADAVARHVGVR